MFHWWEGIVAGLASDPRDDGADGSGHGHGDDANEHGGAAGVDVPARPRLGAGARRSAPLLSTASASGSSTPSPGGPSTRRSWMALAVIGLTRKRKFVELAVHVESRRFAVRAGQGAPPSPDQAASIILRTSSGSSWTTKIALALISSIAAVCSSACTKCDRQTGQPAWRRKLTSTGRPRWSSSRTRPRSTDGSSSGGAGDPILSDVIARSSRPRRARLRLPP